MLNPVAEVAALVQQRTPIVGSRPWPPRNNPSLDESQSETLPPDQPIFVRRGAGFAASEDPVQVVRSPAHLTK